MFENFLNVIAENQFAATAIVLVSAVILFFVALKPLLDFIVTKTQTKKDDEIVEALYKAIEAHKEEVEAIHKAANKIKEKKCNK